MKKTLLFIFLVVSASLFKVNAQTEVLLWSDDFSNTDFYVNVGDVLTTVSDTFSVQATNATIEAKLATEDVQGKYASITATDDGGGEKLYFKVASGHTIHGCTNGSYILRAKVRALNGKEVKLKVFSKLDENLVEGTSASTDWTEVETTFDITSLDEGKKTYPVFVFSSNAVQDYDVDDIRIYKLDDATAIKKNVDSGLKIYPNPAVDVVNIEGASVVKTVDITDLSGRTAISVSELSGNKIDVAGLQRGVYLMKVTTDKGIKVVKLVKK